MVQRLVDHCFTILSSLFSFLVVTMPTRLSFSCFEISHLISLTLESDLRCCAYLHFLLSSFILLYLSNCYDLAMSSLCNISHFHCHLYSNIFYPSDVAMLYILTLSLLRNCQRRYSF